MPELEEDSESSTGGAFRVDTNDEENDGESDGQDALEENEEIIAMADAHRGEVGLTFELCEEIGAEVSEALLKSLDDGDVAGNSQHSVWGVRFHRGYHNVTKRRPGQTLMQP